MIIDMSILRAMVRDVGIEMFPGIRDVYVQEATETIERIQKALSSGDYQTLARDIHTQKSVLGTYGAAAALEQALSLDRKCKAGVAIGEMEAEIRQFIGTLLETRDAVSGLTAEDLKEF
ncbi:Hpt domain-containing protein [Succinimonas amylolytica]|jgi:HPt (histidine-containing phosphotransfer) domain-containing protein|uniref:Hpt domain-containing protein n=1 Tax=Succinimonas amylolytica TaxID=83769 RepID=UPI000368E566|nr:Hpt domain-containing protein [Succinimonas amylolytica]